MTHIKGHNDEVLHDANGEHIVTPPTADGAYLAAYDRRIRYHLACHKDEEAAAERAEEEQVKTVSGRFTSDTPPVEEVER